MSKPTSINDGVQLINQASDEERRMEAHLVATKVQGGFGHEFLIFWKMMQGRSLRISPIPL
jgi:hypothetical protein